MDRVRNTPLGGWLANVAPDVLKAVGGLIAEKAVWPVIRNMLNRRRLKKDDMQHAEKLAAVSFSEIRADLWKHDNLHGSWLAKNTRPLITLCSLAGAALVTYLESTGHDVGDMWEGVWATLALSCVGTYFVLESLNDGRPKNRSRKLFGRRLDSRDASGTA